MQPEYQGKDRIRICTDVAIPMPVKPYVYPPIRLFLPIHSRTKNYRGHGNYLQTQGITHAGTGTSGIPVRFNTRGEVLIHHLI